MPSKPKKPQPKNSPFTTATPPALDLLIHCKYDALLDPFTVPFHPRNDNTHPPSQIKALAQLFKSTGVRHPAIISTLSKNCVAGHGRLLAAQQLRAHYPVVYQPFHSESEEIAFLLADNKLSELSEIDSSLTASAIEAMHEEFRSMTGYMDDEIQRLLLKHSTDPLPDPEPRIDEAEVLNQLWKCAPGDLWKIGPHRLLCGDSTLAENVTRLLDGAVPGMMVTDPPYGVEYDADWRNKAERSNGKKVGASALGKVMNDGNADWSPAWELFPGDVAYVYHAHSFGPVVEASIKSAGFKIRSPLVWAKNQLAISRADYHFKHEACFYAVREGRTASWVGGRDQTTLWEIDKPRKSETGHSTQKPVECMSRPIRNHSHPLIYDPFLGSGTTMVAAQHNHRTCYGLELSPNYCAVILQRMRDAFPELVIERLP